MKMTILVAVECSGCGTHWYDYQNVHTKAYLDKYGSLVIYENVDKMLPKKWKKSADGEHIFCPKCQ